MNASGQTDKRKMLQTMIFGAVLIFFTGFVHIWSVFVPHVMALTGWTEGQTTMAFYLSNGFFVAGSIIGGRLGSAIGAKKVILIGGGVFALSVFLSGMVLSGSPVLLYLLYGCGLGVGEGMVYSVILDTAQKWFPERTGFASGVIITSNGLCPFFMAPLCRKLISARGAGAALSAVGLMIAAAWLLAFFFVQVPPLSGKRSGDAGTAGDAGADVWSGRRQYTPSEMLRTKQYYLLALAMLCALMPYFLISPVSQTYQINRGIAQQTAVLAVMIGSLCNAGTRLALPTLADIAGRIPCLQALTLVLGAAMLMLAAGRGFLLSVGVVLSYGCFGGAMGSFPSLTSELFGLKYAGSNYGFVMIGLIISTLCAPVLRSVLGGFGLPEQGMYYVGLLFAAAAFLLLSGIRRKPDEPRRVRGRN